MTSAEADPRTPVHLAASELEVPDELSARRVRRRVLIIGGLVLAIVVLVSIVPGLDGLRVRLSHARPAWLILGVGLKVLSGLGYVVVFRMIFCRRMSWSVSAQIGMSELGANALLPTGGAGGLALGAWALRRGRMPAEEIARRTVAFFLLTSVPNVLGLILVGIGLAVGVFPGEANLALTLAPAAVAAGAIVATLLAGRGAARLHRRLQRTREGELSRRASVAWKTFAAIADGVDDAVALLREGNLWLVGGLLAYLVFDVMILWTAFRCFGAAPSLAIVWIAYLIGELGGLIPLPGGIGGVDLGLVGTLVLYHVPITAATSAVLAYRATALLVPSLLGAAAFAVLRRTLREESSKVAVCAARTEMEVIGLGRVVVGPG